MSDTRDICWPTIKDRASARKAVSPAATASLCLGLLSTVLALASRGAPQNALTEPLPALIKAALFCAVAYGLYYRISRTAAIAGMSLVLYNVAWASQARGPSWLAIIVALLFVAAIRATFIFHKLEQGRSTASTRSA